MIPAFARRGHPGIQENQKLLDSRARVGADKSSSKRFERLNGLNNLNFLNDLNSY
jgi:hypothetical protein